MLSLKEGGRKGHQFTGHSSLSVGGKNTKQWGVDAWTTPIAGPSEKGYQAPTEGGREKGGREKQQITPAVDIPQVLLVNNNTLRKLSLYVAHSATELEYERVV